MLGSAADIVTGPLVVVSSSLWTSMLRLAAGKCDRGFS